MFDWNDIRLFLAVSESGSALRAARQLGVNQTTVARRIDALEHQLGLTLFDRRTTGYRLTEDGVALLAAARPMGEQAGAILARAERQRRGHSGLIRVTAPEVIFSHFVAPIVAEFHHRHPEVRIEYDGSETFVDLAQGGADVAIRATEQPHAEGLVSMKLGEVHWTAYCSTAYAQRNGLPGGPDDLSRHQVVAYSGLVAERGGNKWFMRKVEGRQIAGYSGSVANMTGILRAGLGIGLLPCFHGDSEAGLMRCFPPHVALNSTLWILTPEERRKIPRIDAFVGLAIERMRARRKELSR